MHLRMREFFCPLNDKALSDYEDAIERYEALKKIRKEREKTVSKHIRQRITAIDKSVPRKINFPGSFQEPPIMLKRKSTIERHAEMIQKKQNASILKTIIPIRIKLKIDIVQDKANNPHQVLLDSSNLFSESPGKNGVIAIPRTQI